MPQPLSPELFRRWCRSCLAALGHAREEIDALNVYPVPDNDTGTNLFLTFEAAVAALEADDAGSDLASGARVFVDGALRGARGNSGVIMSQLLRACVLPVVAAAVRAEPRGTVQASVLADALGAASAAAYAAVGQPVEGTILSVARASATAASTAAVAGAAVDETLVAAADAARVALSATPGQLDLLRRAGVVDAGGRGLCVVLDSTVGVLTGEVRPDPDRGRTGPSLPVPHLEADLSAQGPSYEVMYLLDAGDDRIPALRATLTPLGDSLVVVGGEGLWNVHVHVDDVGAAIEAGLSAGRPHRIAVTHFAELMTGGAAPLPATSRAVIAAGAGPGLVQLFEGAGALALLLRPGWRSSTAEFLEAIETSQANEVVLLPNMESCLPAAEAAARRVRERGVRVAVIPTRAQVQGLAALAVHDPARGFDDDVVAMTTAAGHTRHGGVTIATTRGITMAGPCEPGDVLGVLEGDFALIGSDLGVVAGDVVRQLLGGGGELLTLVTGEDTPPGLTDEIEAAVRSWRPDVDTIVLDGGQVRYPLLVGVE